MTPACGRPLAERVVLRLHKLGADVRPPARDLGFSLACDGRRFGELSKALKRLRVEGIVDYAQWSGASNGRGRGYALTERGRRWAECLRQASDSGTSTERDPSAASSAVASVSGSAFPVLGGSGKRDAAGPRDVGGEWFGGGFRGCVSGAGWKRKRDAAHLRDVGGEWFGDLGACSRRGGRPSAREALKQARQVTDRMKTPRPAETADPAYRPGDDLRGNPAACGRSARAPARGLADGPLGDRAPAPACGSGSRRSSPRPCGHAVPVPGTGAGNGPGATPARAGLGAILFI